MEAIISSAETDNLHGEAEIKRQELNDAKLLVEDATEQLKSECQHILSLSPSFPAVKFLIFVSVFDCICTSQEYLKV